MKADENTPANPSQEHSGPTYKDGTCLPDITPQIVKSGENRADETQELDMSKYGYCYEPWAQLTTQNGGVQISNPAAKERANRG